MLPELQAAAWTAMRNGIISVDAIPAIRGKRRRVVQPDELARYCAYWPAARLTRDGHDAFVDVKVRRPSPVPVNWRSSKPSDREVEAAMKEAPEPRHRRRISGRRSRPGSGATDRGARCVRH
jgi:hypothetical protein